MIQRMLAIWSLVPLPFLNSACISVSFQFIYCWSLAWAILRLYNCAVVWAFFGVALLSCWNGNWLFPILWLLLSFPNLLAYSVQRFQASFRLWNSSAGIPSPALAVFVMMLPKPTWLRIPECLALGEWSHHRGYLGHKDLFLYSSSVCSCHLFLISSASVCSVTFLSFIEPIFAWNVPLVSLNFLKRSLVFPILFIVFPYILALFT